MTHATPSVSGKEARHYSRKENHILQCQLCFRNCIIPPGKTGFCRVRENRNGRLVSLVYGLPSAVQIDPIEKEPCYHMLPGTQILCLGTAGCNFACRHCHNWHLSQASPGELSVYSLSPEDAVDMALEKKIKTISFTYNDPIVFYEYMLDIARLAKQEDLRILWHTNGSINACPLKEILKYTDAVTVDLKGFSDEAYANSEGRLGPVLKTLKTIKQKGVWLEIVNLIIPTVNDNPDEIREMCKWIRDNLGKDVPLHFSRFFPSYLLKGLSPMPIKTLESACTIARETGLHYVTLGNVPGHRYNSTYCPACGRVVIDRTHFEVKDVKIVDGCCAFCQQTIPGIWE